MRYLTENNGHQRRTSKSESKLKHEEIFEDEKDIYSLQGLLYNGNPINDDIYYLSKTILNKPKYRKLFLKNSFKEVVFENIKSANGASIEKLQDLELDSDAIRWLTIYKWILRKRIPFINDFEFVEGLVSKEVPFLQEWVMSIDLPIKLLENSKNEKENINYFDALMQCKKLGLLTEKYKSIFCLKYNAHIVHDLVKNFNENGLLHDDCNGSFFEGCIYEIDNDFIEFWFKDKGTTFELWFYYTLMNYLHEKFKKEYNIFRNMEVYYIKSTLQITEIDVLAVVAGGIIACECKNTADEDMGMILKFYGVMNMLGINYGIFACTSEYNEKIIPKNEVFNKYGIVIIDNLIHKSKDDIFKELDKIFEKL